MCFCDILSFSVIFIINIIAKRNISQKHIDVKKPRICGRQIMRDNVQVEGPEDYFRKSITVPFLGLIK